jgi:hypothetical protein
MHKENWCCQSRIIKDRNQGFLLFLKALFFLPEPGKSQDGLEYWSIHIDIHEYFVFWTIPCFSPASIAQSSCVCMCQSRDLLLRLY